MESSFLTTLLALSAILFGLSIVVQTVQEIYKYITNSKSRAYANAMRDFMGALFSRVVRSGVVQDLRVKGPFQVFRFRPKDHTLPLTKPVLEEAIRTTLTPWKQQALEALTREMRIQRGTSALPSPAWRRFESELHSAAERSDDPGTDDIVSFLADWKLRPSKRMDAGAMLEAFRDRFLSASMYYVEHYDSFLESFSFQYKRRNVRHSFTIALLLTIVCNLSIQEVYHTAERMSDQQAVQLLGTASALQQTLEVQTKAADEQGPSLDSLQAVSRALARSISLMQSDTTSLFDSQRAMEKLSALVTVGPAPKGYGWAYLFGCLITTVCISFGAPVINDAAGTILALKRGGAKEARNADT